MSDQVGISEVIQDAERLSGDFFVHGVVSATSEENAVHCVFEEIGNHREAWEAKSLEPPYIDAHRVTAGLIGIAVDVTPHEVFAMVYGHEAGLG
jgi:hypothetical protein